MRLPKAVHELVGHFSEPLVVGRGRVGLVEDVDGETPGGAEAGNRGGLEELELDVGQPAAFFLELFNDLPRGPLALGPVFQVDDTGPRVRAAAFRQDLVTGDRSDGGDFFDFFGNLLELLGLGVGVLERGARRRLEDRVDDALVLARDKTSRELRVDDDNAGGKAPDDGQGQRAARDDPPQDRGITARDLFDSAIKRTPHERQENEQEADRPPQIIRQISDPSQDQRPTNRIQQNDP